MHMYGTTNNGFPGGAPPIAEGIAGLPGGAQLGSVLPLGGAHLLVHHRAVVPCAAKEDSGCTRCRRGDKGSRLRGRFFSVF